MQTAKREPALWDELRPQSEQRRTLLKQITALLATTAIPLHGFAQDYPSRPIRMVVPFPPGGGFDALARPIAQKMGGYLKQPIVIDNKAGAGGNIGTGEVARSAADGYTILFGNEIVSIAPHTYKSIPYDPIKSFEPIAMIGTTPIILAVHSRLPAKNLKELIALSAKEPITFGSPGVGSSPHLLGELINLETPLKMRHIPYRGTGPAITDAIGGQINAVLATASAVTAQIKAGELRAIAILSEKRSPLLPGVPTLEEGGLRGIHHDVWYMMLAPASTPGPIVAKLREAAFRALNEPELKERLQGLGVVPAPGDGKMVSEWIKRDYDRWGRIVAAAHIPKT